ncbi:delta-like protein [Elysia marginata]|uniref:Delta-like protein n=1 Tax=Elysia marginata TaxID=1093978 RepID=A0AAV4EH90_9GAST|nr:delta-like protein [Elysia marginata]
MWPRKTALCAVFWTLYFLTILPHGTRCTGVFELQIRSFRNDLGLTSDGTCCNGNRDNGICSESCRTYFKVCLAHYQADIATNPHPRCSFANYSTPVLGGNTMEFSVLSGLPMQSSRQNTFYFPVKNFTWPVSISYPHFHHVGLVVTKSPRKSAVIGNHLSMQVRGPESLTLATIWSRRIRIRCMSVTTGFQRSYL